MPYILHSVFILAQLRTCTGLLSAFVGAELYIRDWQTFSIKAKAVNIFGFLGHMVSVTTTQLCLVCTDAAWTHVSECAWQGSDETLFTDT